MSLKWCILTTFNVKIKGEIIMKFGYFDDANKEYVINSPRTPYPWINYLGNQGFFSLISNTAGGYCFYKDARLQRQDVFGGNSGRQLFQPVRSHRQCI